MELPLLAQARASHEVRVFTVGSFAFPDVRVSRSSLYRSDLILSPRGKPYLESPDAWQREAESVDGRELESNIPAFDDSWHVSSRVCFCATRKIPLVVYFPRMSRKICSDFCAKQRRRVGDGVASVVPTPRRITEACILEV